MSSLRSVLVIAVKDIAQRSRDRSAYIMGVVGPLALALILSATLALTPDDPATISARADEFNDYRKRTQPPGATIGSMFENPPGDYAGRLIDAAGLKGRQIGGAQISEKHANFFLNVADATGADVKALVDLTREVVFEQFGVRLELEVELIGEW